MTQLQTIVAATDLSAASRHATDRAAELAKAHAATLTLVHTLGASALDDLRRWIGEDEDAPSAVQSDARTRLRALAEELQQRHGTRVAEHLAAGHPVQEITRIANVLEADLLVTGTRGAGFFRGVVIGSTAERVASRSARPVLMVRQSVHGPYRRVLVPVDFSPWSLGAIELAHRIAPDAVLVLMHAVELPYEGKLRFAGVDGALVARYRDGARREASQRLQDLAAQTGLAPDRLRVSLPDGADPWMLIAQEELERDCDLVVIGKQGRHALADLLLGSTTRMVLAECSADVVVCTRPAD